MSTQPLLFEELAPVPARARDHSPHGDVPSILKWTGSKRSQAREIARFAPDFRRYYEPFVGGGALLYVLGREGSVASDLFEPLIGFWSLVRDNPTFLKANYREQWTRLQEDLPGYFYGVRERFNRSRQPEDLNFLMRTCVNGIVRFSRKGEFNNSFHLSRRGMMPARFDAIVDTWHQRLQGIDLRCCDYREAVRDATSDDFVYLDPPYAGNKQRYVSDLQLEDFYTELERLNSRGIRWALSFDGSRGEREYRSDIPRELYRRKEILVSGLSAVAKVLNGPIEQVSEALYLSY